MAEVSGFQLQGCIPDWPMANHQKAQLSDNQEPAEGEPMSKAAHAGATLATASPFGRAILLVSSI